MRLPWVRWCVCWALCLVALFYQDGAAATARELHWRELSVQARLDADGRLHVSERQVMVFTGDWNGGERSFRLAGEHELTLESVARVEPTGGEVALRPGDLTLTDEYAWADSDSRVLRWRSRQPQDPPFNGTELTYVLRYQLENILVHAGDRSYRLDHDFAFTEREGNIARFTLDLELDPAWQTEGAASRHLELGPLPPGDGAVLVVPLEYIGTGSPAGVLHAAPLLVRLLLAILLCAFAIVGLRRFFGDERRLGRFVKVIEVKAIDAAWLQEHVLSLQPEVVGAAYDHKTGAAEVAAVLARMVLEKKLESRVTRVKRLIGHRENLELSLLVERDKLQGYERALVKGLFFSGNETSTDAIRAHYKNRGFDPASRLEKPLEERVNRSLGASDDAKTDALLRLLGVGALTVVIAIIAVALRPSELPSVAPGLLAAGCWTTLAVVLAYRWSVSLTASAAGSLKFLLPLGLGLQGVVGQLLSLEVSFMASLGLALWGLSLTLGVTYAARSVDGAEGLALRKRLAAARRYFQKELERETPRLDDAWFPYLMALDLGKNVDGWFRAFGGPNASAGVGVGVRSARSSIASRSGAVTSSGGGWTGGGGAFGGAGATGTWISATSALAAGVTAPSSSSSSGGGRSSGGGSSGGGGGGGW